MTEVESLAGFVDGVRLGDLSADALHELKIRVLDTVGVAIGALDAAPVVAVRSAVSALGGTPMASLIGGGRTAPDRAALANAAASRYLDFMDSYLAPGETCHPSDSMAAVLAATQSRGGTGAEFLAALAVAYQVQARLSDEAPVRQRGFDHTVHTAYAAAAGCAKALGLPADRIAQAVAISGTANNALRVTRTGSLSHWKGLAAPNAAKEALHAAVLAAHGITGPREVFEGTKGFRDSLGGEFEVDWADENLERVRRTILKRHNAEIHSQSAIDAALDIRERPTFAVDAVRAVRLTTFDVAYQIIGGGQEGDKTTVRTKEEADHSLPFLLATALLDGQLQPGQYTADRIARPPVQQLMKLVEVVPDPNLSARFPAEMPAELEVGLDDGSVLAATRDDHEGFHTRPMGWTAARAKFDRVADGFTDPDLRDELSDVIATLEDRPVTDLTSALERVRLRPD